MDKSRNVVYSDVVPDKFELDFGLNPNEILDVNEKTLDPSGNYTNPEMHLHYLVKDIILF